MACILSCSLNKCERLKEGIRQSFIWCVVFVYTCVSESHAGDVNAEVTCTF